MTDSIRQNIHHGASMRDLADCLPSGLWAGASLSPRAGVERDRGRGGRSDGTGEIPSLLVLDNYDSFTYNLVQLLSAAGADVRVARNDKLTVDEVVASAPRGIVLSPGPGRPERAGICVELLCRRVPVPLLGVCLGHQAMAVAFGGRVEGAPRLMHGKTSEIRHGSSGLFAGLESPLRATRYHSLVVPESSLPDELEPVAWAEDGTLQAMRHRELPYWGVQFHPESILTPGGPRLIANFLRLCAEAG